MKQLLSTFAILLVAVSLQAQNLYFETSTGNNINYVESAHLGVNFDIGNEYTLRAQSGFAQIGARGHYMDLGFALERPIPITITENLSPVASVDIRAYSGEKFNSTHREGLDNGIAYGLFTGLKYHALQIGASFEQYPYHGAKIYVNPSLRLSL